MSIVLQPGEFYGVSQFGSCNAGFEIRAAAATGSEDDVHRHTHQDAHFVLVLSGSYISSARGAAGLPGPPALIFNPPGTTHRDRFARGTGTFVTMSISAESFKEIPTAPQTADAVRLCGIGALTAGFRIARELRETRDALVLESSVWELFEAVAEFTRPAEEPEEWLRRAYEAIMDQAVETNIRVRDIARAVGVHPVHLARAFRANWGCSPGELVRWRRVDLAAELLRGSRMPAAEVAIATGFVDQSHMTHAFRAVYGTTPVAYRCRMFHGYKPARMPRG